MTPSDMAILDQLRAHAEAHRVGADLIREIADRRIASVVTRDPRHRAFLSDGLVVIFSIEDFSKIEPVETIPPFARRGWVRHASVSQQTRAGNVVPTEPLVRELATSLGFSPAALVFASPDRAGPFIQHVLEDERRSGP